MSTERLTKNQREALVGLIQETDPIQVIAKKLCRCPCCEGKGECLPSKPCPQCHGSGTNAAGVYLLTEFAKSQQHEALHEAKQRCYQHGKALPDDDRRRGAWDCIEVISDQIREIVKQ